VPVLSLGFEVRILSEPNLTEVVCQHGRQLDGRSKRIPENGWPRI